MTAISLHQLHFQFSSDRVIFQQLSHSFLPGKQGIVGDNGSGKSVLAALICGQYLPDAGTLIGPISPGFLTQQHYSDRITIADFLGQDARLAALRRVLSGYFSPQDLLLAEDNWLLEEQLRHQLADIHIAADPQREVASLSGGEQTRLMLWKLFTGNHDWLILDEPGNHLDLAGRRWLQQEIERYTGNLLLISHDRDLLEQMPQIHELSDGHLRSYGGNYSLYQQQKQEQHSAQLRQLTHQKEQLKTLRIAQQNSIERAEKRAKSGKKLRDSGSQCLLLLDKMKNSAEMRRSSSLRHADRKIEQTQTTIADMQQKLQQPKALNMVIDTQNKKSRYAVQMDKLIMPYGYQGEITQTIFPGERYWLQGNNGCGKSTLLKILTGKIIPQSGTVKMQGRIAYFDQHQSLLQGSLSVLDNLRYLASGLTESEYRTQLANIGFRRDNVFKLAGSLSGGQRVRLALLAITSGSQPASILLLDEPDNHLDLHARQMFEQAIAGYNGTLMVVSHDRHFIDNIEVTHCLKLMS
ncbi:ABC-F family ATP-binding cassette domain-containing protein [Limnobaculum zhutongyuii]|uniref:ABC-F family ATP-binding cassette domain-containing protein n=1 Tax=Limnobaculum zhutongyuii TaxID=2498113 RepID=A0A411WKG9_9GAMM|nr:ABC-F family ATP-binding cassette domain-containing protein [Limnobaculum zhutongyuii]QBH96658.1 ABC-F family ATP-binding cassette domain-containing protein [Limnobaculum zhutongyuii]TQS90310.1 ABC-F family ATP-binding cassette domain-containing protein [Limnobaculum zhutongyuii]